MSFLERYKRFLSELEGIAETHDELTDTDVRERLHEVLNYHFIWAKESKAGLPKRFAMFSAEGDKRVAKAVHSFVHDALVLVESSKVPPGKARHALLEDPKAVTGNGNAFDVFLGSSDEPLSPSKPTPDKSFRYEKPTKKHATSPPLDLTLLVVDVAGMSIAPTFDGKSTMYEYKLPDGDMIGVTGSTVEEVRESAREALQLSLKMRAKFATEKERLDGKR